MAIKKKSPKICYPFFATSKQLDSLDRHDYALSWFHYDILILSTFIQEFFKMAEIRSSLEIAMEKADRLGRVSKEELETKKWLDLGRRIAARYLQDKKKEFKGDLGGISGSTLPLVLKGATETLLRNIVLPKDEEQWSVIERALNGFMELKGSVANDIVFRIEQLLKKYKQTRDQYHTQLQSQMQSQLGGIQQAISEQYGMKIKLGDLDSLPEFKKEWARLSLEIKEQFEQQLIPLKAYLERL